MCVLDFVFVFVILITSLIPEDSLVVVCFFFFPTKQKVHKSRPQLGKKCIEVTCIAIMMLFAVCCMGAGGGGVQFSVIKKYAGMQVRYVRFTLF